MGFQEMNSERKDIAKQGMEDRARPLWVSG